MHPPGPSALSTWVPDVLPQGSHPKGPPLKLPTQISYDRVANADRLRVAALSVRAFDALETHPIKEERLLALAGAFTLMSEAYGIPAQEVFTCVKRLMTDPLKEEGLVLQFSGLRYHIETELLA